MATSFRERKARARSYAKAPEFKRLLRYLTVSAVTSVFSLGSLYVFFRVLKVGSAAEANVLATALTTVPSYYLNRTWAWGQSGRSHLMREVVPFWLIALASLVLSTLAVGFAAHEAHHVTHSHFGVTVLVESANLFTYGLLWIGKFVLFNKLFFAKDRRASAESGGTGMSGPLDPQVLSEV